MYRFTALLTVFLVFNLSISFGQESSSAATYTITGKVVDEDKQILEFATVALLKAQDSTTLTGGMTNTEGIFKFKAPAGKYLLQVKFLGYEPQFVPDIQLGPDNPTVKVSDIQLKSKTTTLDEVEITSQRSRMEFSMDKRVFNVGQDLSNIGGSVTDLLDNIPSITTDIDGNVSLRGNGNVRILINGNPSSMTSAEALQQLPANLIERVEIITNPSARYEAQGTAGILNIVLKKNRKSGWNGTVNASAGYPESHNLAVNMNFRQDKLNWFTNVSGRYRNVPRETLEHRERLANGEITSIIDQEEESWRKGKSGGIRFGADYLLDDNTTLTGSIFYRIQDGDNTEDIEFLFYNPEYQLQNFNYRRNAEDEDESGLDYTLSFEKKFNGKQEHKLNVNLIYNSEGEIEDANAREELFNAAGVLREVDLLQRTYNEENRKEYTILVDYTQPIGENGKFEAGYRGGIRRIETRYSVEEFNNETSVWDTLQNLTNNFDYDEDIHALYASYGHDFNKISYQVGLRTEYTDVVTLLRTTNEENPRDYINFFPSAYLNYEFKEGNALQVNYSRRLERPDFWDLNPFFNFNNPLYLRSGNPNLNPEFTDSYELNYIRTWEKASVSASIYYRNTEDVITRVTRVDEDGVSTSIPENLATQNDIGTEFSLNLNPTNDWDITWTGNFFRGEIDGANLGFARQTVFTSWTTRLNSRIQFLEKYQGQIMINYRGPEKTPQGRREDFFFADIGIARDIFNEKATVSFRVSNILDEWYRYETAGEDFFIYRQGQWRSQRSFMVDFTYRINQEKSSRRGGGRGRY